MPKNYTHSCENECEKPDVRTIITNQFDAFSFILQTDPMHKFTIHHTSPVIYSSASDVLKILLLIIHAVCEQSWDKIPNHLYNEINFGGEQIKKWRNYLEIRYKFQKNVTNFDWVSLVCFLLASFRQSIFVWWIVQWLHKSAILLLNFVALMKGIRLIISWNVKKIMACELAKIYSNGLKLQLQMLLLSFDAKFIFDSLSTFFCYL